MSMDNVEMTFAFTQAQYQTLADYGLPRPPIQMLTNDVVAIYHIEFYEIPTRTKIYTDGTTQYEELTQDGWEPVNF